MRGEGGTPVRVLIAEDQALVREGIRVLLSGKPDLQVVGEAKDGREALELCRELRPDLVLMDVRMPRMDGIEATRAIKDELPTVSVLMVTNHQDPDYLFEAIRAGAAGYVLKDATRQRLLVAVRRVLAGESPLNQELAMQLLLRLSNEMRRGPAREVRRHRPTDPSASVRRLRGPSTESAAVPLSAKEVEVVRLLAQGKTNREVGLALMVSLSTVKTYVWRIMLKLGVADRTQAAVRAVELGLMISEE